MPQNFRVDIASPPDRDRLVAQILFGDEQWAELNQDSGILQLEIYPKRSGEPWTMDLRQAIEALRLAEQRLIGD